MGNSKKSDDKQAESSVQQQPSSKNYDAEVHNLKEKIKLVENKSPSFRKYETYTIDVNDTVSYKEKMRGLNKQKCELSKAKIEVCFLHEKLTTVYEALIREYKTTDIASRLTVQLNKLESEKGITGLISNLESIEARLVGLLIEVDMTISCEVALETPAPNITSKVPMQPEPANAIKKGNGIKLTCIDVPDFDGESENYASFIAVFDQLVHENEELSEIEKAIRLQQSLKGRAAMCIKGIPVTTENYEIMYSKLRRKFEMASANKHAIVERLENLAEAGKDTDECMNKLSEIEVILNHLESAKMSITFSTNLVFHRIILSKFPDYIVERVVDKTKDDNFTVDDLIRALEKEIFNKNFTQKAKIKKQIEHERTQPNLFGRQGSAVPSGNMNMFTAKRNSQKTSSSCIFCNNQYHTSERCRKSNTAKVDQLKEHRRCWKCFEKNHTSFNCRSADCSCGGKHHPSICPNQQRQDIREPWNSNYNSWHRNKSNQYNTNTANTLRRLERNNPSTTTRVNFRTFENPMNPQGNSNSREGVIHTSTLEESEEHTSTSEHPEYLQQNHVTFTNKITLPVTQSNSIPIPTLMTCEGHVFSPAENKYITCTIFFDTGAQRTLVNENFANRLGIKEGELNVFNMSGVNETTERFVGKRISIKLLTEDKSIISLPALTKPFISKGFLAANLDKRDYEFLKNQGVLIAKGRTSGEMQRPDILVGADNYTKLVINKASIILPSGINAVETAFGYCLFGQPSNSLTKQFISEDQLNHSAVVEQNEDETSPNEMLKQMYELESLGIKHDGSPTESNAIEYFEKYKKCLDFSSNIVTAPFPLKPDLSKLGNNYPLAYKRLLSLTQSFESNQQKKALYEKTIEKYIDDGIVEEVESNEEAKNVGIYYIPHHGVWKPEKVEKPLRIVFDASAKQKGCISLNEGIETGEIFVNKIQDILMATRKSKYILMCDIQGAFTQIRMVEEHQNLCRFLWIKDISKSLTKENLKIYRFKRLPFGITASPSILNMAIISFLETVNSEIGYEILKHIYVDNVMLFGNTIQSVQQKIGESKKLFKAISFNLREYVTNVPSINAQIPSEDIGKTGDTKILGVKYNTDLDQFTLKMEITPSVTLTKRAVLSQLHQIYDPIGLMAPAIISLRFAMREIFHTTTHWSDKLNEESREFWENLLHRYNNAKVTIPRYLGDEHAILSNQILWVFTDASSTAFAACAYLQNKVTLKVSRLITGKAKLAPKLKVPLEDTIPKFEFSSILLGVEVSKNVIKNLELRSIDVYIVNDSTSALSWVHSSKTLRRSCNLIKEKINRTVKQTLSDHEINIKFFHCPTDFNVADVGSRGCAPQTLQNSDWLQGPKWIEQSFDTLPLVQFEVSVQSTDEVEDFEGPISVNQQIIKESEHTLNMDKFESSHQSKRVVGRILNMLKRKLLKARKTLNKPIAFTSELLKLASGNVYVVENADLKLAAYAIIKSEQEENDVDVLIKKYKGKLFVKDKMGLIRFQSRLQNSELTEDIKNPLFLPADSKWLKLHIAEFHNEQGHCGKEFLKMLTRQKFWIPKPSKVINEVIRNCIPCRKINCLPFRAPLMSSLPKDRVELTRAFANTGIDCLGPFETKEKEKMYICLFTCLVFRGIHLEIIDDMSGIEFLRAFIRFTSRRGIPKIIRSDNGTNFVLGQKMITAVFAKDESNNSVMNYCKHKDIKWVFNPPEASWFGGVWEIMVKAVKQSFYKTIGRNKFSVSEFHTLVIKIEGIINVRPLTAIDTDDYIQPIRPIDFICPGLQITPPPFNENMEDEEYKPDEKLNMKQVKKTLSRIERISERFLERFENEYLPTLRDSQKHVLIQGRCTSQREPQLKEVVLIKDRHLPKYKWNIGQIAELRQGKDGKIRSAIVICDKQRLHRSITHLFPLELNGGNPEKVEVSINKHEGSELGYSDPGNTDNVDISNPHTNKPFARRAAVEASRLIKVHANNNLTDPDECSSDENSLVEF